MKTSDVQVKNFNFEKFRSKQIDIVCYWELKGLVLLVFYLITSVGGHLGVEQAVKYSVCQHV